MEAHAFGSADAFRTWLKRNHAAQPELLVLFFNKDSGRAGMTYPQALDEALCFGWIDGVRRRVDKDTYSIRFTPRKTGSIWSVVNVRHAERLIRSGRMAAAGLRAYQARDPRRTGVYSFENRPRVFPPELERVFRSNPTAWAHWEKQPPGYRRTATWWVVSAVKEETRARRLRRLIGDAAAGRRLGLLL